MQQAYPGVMLKVDEDRISALSADRDALWARVASADFLDVEERRTILGL
jgi:phage portal protein BeeE